MMPIVSVIIPNYNHGKFLKQRIESILNQSFSDFELILLDDCSTDNSTEIIESFRSNSKVKHIIYNDSNSGNTFKQWKKGIELAKGQIVWITESDDVADSSFLKETIKLFNKSVGFIYTQSKSIDENGVITDSWISHTNDLDATLWKHDFSLNGKEFVNRYMLYKNVIPNASAVVFKKDLYYKAGGLNTNYTLNGDWDLYTRILKLCNIAFVHKPLNYFRQHSTKGSIVNVNNGNNVKEYYWLAKSWKNDFQLTTFEEKKLNKHIYSIWKTQSEQERFRLFSKNFLNIFPAALRQDKSVLFKILLA